MTLRQALPSVVTMVVLACGLAAIEAARVANWDLALRLILIAAVADGMDGTIARRLNATSAMGKQLDSLADIVAFGVAPAFLFAAAFVGEPDPARFGVAFVFVAAGAYRLARFNAHPTNGVFCGLPITAAGALLAITIAGPFSAGIVEAGVVAVALSVLMVGRHPFPTFAAWRWTLLPAFVVAVVPIALWPGVETVAVIAAVIFGFYVIWGLASKYVDHRARENEKEEEAPAMPTNGKVHLNGKGSYWAFLRAFVRDRKTVGAVAPTSRGVARRIARLAEVNGTRTIAEFGPGTGAITQELLAALPEDGRLWAFEVYPPFVAHLRDSINDPRITVLAESAEAIDGVRERETEWGFDAIVSSIPFSLIGPEQTTEILRAVARTLRPGGVFVALQYHPRYLAPLLRAEFASVEREVYPWNIPPATLLCARRPHCAE